MDVARWRGRIVCAGPKRLEICNVGGEDQNVVAAGFMISHGHHDRVDGRGCSPAGRYDLVVAGFEERQAPLGRAQFVSVRLEVTAFGAASRAGQREIGLIQTTSRKRAKSESALTIAIPCSMARAASAASLTRFPRSSRSHTSR